MKTKQKLQTAVLQGRFDFFSSLPLECPRPFSGFEEHLDRFFISSGIPHAPCNGVIEKQEKALTSTEIDKALHFFQHKKMPFLWWTQEKLPEEKGFLFGGVLKGIALEIPASFSSPLPRPPSLKIKRVQNEKELKIFCDITTDVFAMPAHTKEAFFEVTSLLMQKKRQINFLAFLEDTPVATTTLATFPSSAGIWNCATLPPYRKKGILSALIQEALLEAQRQQYKEVMAILMPKGQAATVFQHFGFQEIVDFPFYIYGATALE